MSISGLRDYIDVFHGPPLSVLSDCIRGFLVPKPGHDFIVADFNAIEARVLCWLAGQEDMLAAFRENKKIYEGAAARIYNVRPEEIGKEDIRRLVGKVSILACGYQGAVGAFQAMAKAYGLKMTDEEALQVVLAYRKANRNIVEFWAAVEETAKKAVKYPGTVFSVPNIAPQILFRFHAGYLWCCLPSRRALCYPSPEVQWKEKTNWKGETYQAEVLTYMTEDKGRWTRVQTYGGSLVENITQGVARDLLANAMKNCEREGYPIVLHVHDELGAEVPEGFGSVEEMAGIMETLPDWAHGLPVKAEGWRGKRYRK